MILSSNLQTEMNRGFVTNTQRMGKSVRILFQLEFYQRCQGRQILGSNRPSYNPSIPSARTDGGWTVKDSEGNRVALHST